MQISSDKSNRVPTAISIAPAETRHIVWAYRMSGMSNQQNRSESLPTMSDIVNLNKYRKRSRRNEAVKLASENRARFGRDKAERARAQAEQERQARTLDRQRLEGPDEL